MFKRCFGGKDKMFGHCWVEIVINTGVEPWMLDAAVRKETKFGDCLLTLCCARGATGSPGFTFRSYFRLPNPIASGRCYRSGGERSKLHSVGASAGL